MTRTDYYAYNIFRLYWDFTEEPIPKDIPKDLTKEELVILAIASENAYHRARAILIAKKEMMLKKGLDISDVSLDRKNDNICNIIEARRQGIVDPYIEISTLMDRLGLDMRMRESYLIPRIIRNAKDTGKFNYMVDDYRYITGPVFNGDSRRLKKDILTVFAEKEKIIGQTDEKIFAEVFPDGVVMDADYITEHIIQYTIDNYGKYYGEYPEYMEPVINKLSEKTK